MIAKWRVTDLDYSGEGYQIMLKFDTMQMGTWELWHKLHRHLLSETIWSIFLLWVKFLVDKILNVCIIVFLLFQIRPDY